MIDRVDCDLEFEELSEAWTADVVKLLAELTSSLPKSDAAQTAAAQEDSPWTRKNPFEARLVVNRVLTGDESDKSVRHYEIDLGDSAITYARVREQPHHHTPLPARRVLVTRSRRGWWR